MPTEPEGNSRLEEISERSSLVVASGFAHSGVAPVPLKIPAWIVTNYNVIINLSKPRKCTPRMNTMVNYRWVIMMYRCRFISCSDGGY